MPYRSSRLREQSNGSSTGSEDNLEKGLQNSTNDMMADSRQNQTCTLRTHDEGFSKLDVLINRRLLPSHGLPEGTRLRITLEEDEAQFGIAETHDDASKSRGGLGRRVSCEFCCPYCLSESNRQKAKHHEKAALISYVFIFQEMPPDLLSKHPHLDVSFTSYPLYKKMIADPQKVSISQNIAASLGFQSRCRVRISRVRGSFPEGTSQV